MRLWLLGAVILAVIGVIAVLEMQKAGTGGSGGDFAAVDIVPREDKDGKYEPAAEIVNPSGFLNTEPVRLADFIGKKVVMVDFWTYSCINCQRTLPYLNGWWEKYKDEGLVILGVHTPEFDFEKDLGNVRRAADKYGVEYPIILDNDYSTWRAYRNRYWPRKYLIDIDGYIVYDHIGEGGYEETERVIQRLLAERAERHGEPMEVAGGVVDPGRVEEAPRGFSVTPEIYFGSSRNSSFLGNQPVGSGFQAPSDYKRDHFYLDGDWVIAPEYAESGEGETRIILPYRARKVFMVAEADGTAEVEVLIDGQPVGELSGGDVVRGQVEIGDADLYRLVEDEEVGEHLLELIIRNPGFKAFTFTFG